MPRKKLPAPPATPTVTGVKLSIWERIHLSGDILSTKGSLEQGLRIKMLRRQQLDPTPEETERFGLVRLASGVWGWDSKNEVDVRSIETPIQLDDEDLNIIRLCYRIAFAKDDVETGDEHWSLMEKFFTEEEIEEKVAELKRRRR